ncbi:MAG: NAD-dependent epimerase/dehydratase family protein, partial [Subdoligranulum variabile]|nr:NAD-dependent epimerase/dehydratase family protein [Subdoligranulum variabile]
MKKFPSILFVFSLLFMLTACSSSADPSQESSGQTTSPSSQQDSVSVSNAVLESESTESEQSANNTLIVYFSRWGNTEYPSDVDAITSASIVVDNNSRYGTTEYVANMIAENVGGDLHRIETVTPYTADFDELRDVNHDEMSRNYLPELKESNLDISAYDTVFIGYPVWATDVPQAVLSFLKEYDLSGKTVIPFCTHDAYSKLYNIPSTGLRFFTVYGPAGRPDMAYFGFTNKLLKGETIQIFNYGNCKRDFTYVDDIVEGVVRVMQGAPKRKNGEDGLPVPPYAVYN